MHVALAHDYLTQRGGAERVVLAMTRIFGSATLYTALYNPNQTFPEFRDKDLRTSPLQHVAPFRRDPRLALPLLPAAWRATRVTDADVVLASTSGWAHGVRVGPDTAKVAYCHNPARWLYQTDAYLQRPAARAALRPFLPALQRWDRNAAAGVDAYLANSTAVAKRIERTYGITAEVVHPPVSIDATATQEPVDGLEPGFWLTVARSRGYKNVAAVIEGVQRAGGQQLAVVGSPSPGYISSPGVRWLGVVSDAQLRWLYGHARALVSVSNEDFGLTPLEANAMGTPVAVLRAGGFLDSLAEGRSGVWIEAATPAAVEAALRDFPEFSSDDVRAHADRFSVDSFAERLRTVLKSVVEAR